MRALRFAVIAGVLFAGTPAFAQRPVPRYEAITVDSVVRAISGSTLEGMGSCVAKLEGGDIRWRNDGMDPSSNTGTPVSAGSVLTFDSIADARMARFVRADQSNGLLHVTCFAAGGATSISGTGATLSGEIQVGEIATELTLQETDDGSIASGQTADAVVTLPYAFSNTAWSRLTFGAAGTPSSQVWTVQGAAGMTPLSVAQSGTWSINQAGTWTVNQGGNWSVRLQDGSGNAVTSTAGGSRRLVDVIVRDANGDPVTFSGGGSGGAAQADNTALANLTGAGALYDTTPPPITDGNIGAFRMDSDRVLFFKPFAGVTFNVQSNGQNLATAANQSTAIGHLSTLAGAVSGGQFQVACVTGCSGGTTDTEDGSIAAGQTTGININLNYAYDASSGQWVCAGQAAGGAGPANGDTTRTVEASDEPHSVISAASNNATNVKSSAGVLRTIALVNTTNTVYYMRFYDTASTPTCSSATGFKFTLPIPPDNGGWSIPLNVGFANGIGYCITGGGSATDNTNAATGIYGVVTYK